MTKRRRADRLKWQRIIARRFAVTRLETTAFTGAVTLLLLDEFGEPFYAQVDEQPCCVAATGYSWLQHFPTRYQYTVTTMFDPDGNVVQWYIDICRQHGVDAEGIPWFEDLYLDVVASPAGTVRLLDADELEDALRAGIVSPHEYAAAWREARRLLAAIEQRSFPLLALSMLHRALLLQQLAESRPSSGYTISMGSSFRPIHPVAEAQIELSRAIERFRRDGALAEPVMFGSHRTPEAVVIPFALYEQLVEAHAARRRAAAAASASVLAELPGAFDAEDDADVERWIRGEFTADELYERALTRSRPA